MSEKINRRTVVLDPKDPAFRHRLWVRSAGSEGPKLIIFWSRVVKLLAVLVLVAWLALAAALWAFVRYQRGITEVRFVDVAFYPLRRAEYRATLGRHHLATGRLLLEKRNWNEAILRLRAAVAYAPGLLEARQILADFYLQIRRPELALQILEAGAVHAREDGAYLSRLFRIYDEQQASERALQLCAQLLPPRPDPSPVNQLLAHQAAKACLELGRLDEAEEYIRLWQLDQNSDGQILLAHISVARDQSEAAVQRLELLLQGDPRSENSALQLTRLYLKLGRLEDARRTALLRTIARPDSPGGHIDLLNVDWQLHHSEDFSRHTERYLKDFAGDPQALNLLAQVAAETALPELAQQVLDVANRAAHPPAVFLFALMQAQCGAGRFEAALETAGEIDREAGITARAGAVLMALKCRAYFGSHNEPEGEAWLHRFLSQPDYPTGEALRLARDLEKIGALKPAARVFTAVAGQTGASEPALLAVAAFHVRHNNWTEAGALLPRLKGLRLPPTELIENVEANLAFLGTDPR